MDGLFLLPPAGCIDLVTMWNAEKYPEYWLDQIRAIDDAANLPVITHPVATPTPQWGLGVPGEAARLICREIPNIIGWKMIYNYEGQRKMWKILRSLDRHVSIMAAKEMAGDGAENGENQSDSQTDRVDNHRRLFLPSAGSKGPIKRPMQARKAFEPLTAFSSSVSVALQFIFLL